MFYVHTAVGYTVILCFLWFVRHSFANLWGHAKNKLHRLDPLLYRRIETVQQLEQAKEIVHDFQDVQGVEGAE